MTVKLQKSDNNKKKNEKRIIHTANYVHYIYCERLHIPYTTYPGRNFSVAKNSPSIGESGLS